jgi:hypothetical protein
MTRRASVAGLLACAGRCPLWLLGGIAAVLLVLAGCSNTGSTRAQARDDSELHRYDVATVSERTSVGNAEPITLGGVGLVEGLEGTGGDCTHDSYRAMLKDNLDKDRVPNVPALLKSPDCALVIVEALMMPGANKDDRIDVQVKLPPGSQATSLRGGVLRKCYLYNYDFAKNLRPDYQGADRMFIGHKLAVAAGPVLVGTGEGEEEARQKSGRVWGGGRLVGEYPLALVMNQDSQQARYTSLITDRINSTFQGGGLRGPLDSRLAHTKDNFSVSLRVPPQYRHNLERYLRVVRMIPLSDSADLPGKTESDRRSYRQKLADDLLDPARTVVAALRLEALGAKSIPIFKEKGLKSPHPLVRFASAEALAYLGSPSCGEELYRAAAGTPMLRTFALTALASLDEAVCHLKLKELVTGNHDDETRYGAFRALRELNEQDGLVRGDQLNDTFWLHRIATGGSPFVHVATTRRAEVVLFGDGATLRPPFSILAGEFAITSAKGDSRCTVSRFPLRSEPARKQCGLEVEEIIRTMAELGGHYPEVVALLQQAASCDVLSCRLRIDAVPQATSVHELAKSGKDGGEFAAGQDLGRTPGLYQVGLPAGEGAK